jgi:hypothetical protein
LKFQHIKEVITASALSGSAPGHVWSPGVLCQYCQEEHEKCCDFDSKFECHVPVQAARQAAAEDHQSLVATLPYPAPGGQAAAPAAVGTSWVI